MRIDVVIWGNCQAQALGEILHRTLLPRHFRVLRVPPVYLIAADELREVHAAIANCRVLITQPVGDTYRLPGLSSAHVAGLLPAGARVVSFPIAYSATGFPFQVRGYDGAGERIDAPITDYHDLRALVAAQRGLSVTQTLQWWPAPSRAGVHAVADRARAELRRREHDLDVPGSHLLDRPDAMWTITHPTNATFARLAADVLAMLDIDAAVQLPPYECLGARRAPLEAAVASAHGWPADVVRPAWQVDGREVDPGALLAQQLVFYRDRPDVVAATLERCTDRLADLGLQPEHRSAACQH